MRRPPRPKADVDTIQDRDGRLRHRTSLTLRHRSELAQAGQSFQGDAANLQSAVGKTQGLHEQELQVLMS